MQASRRQVIFAFLLPLSVRLASAQRSAREARKAGERARKEAEKRAKRAQKAARRREKEILRRIEERDAQQARNTERILKDRDRQRKSLSRGENEVPSPCDAPEASGQGKKADRVEIRAKQRGIDAPTASSEP